MSGVFISNNAPPRIGLNQYARNGLSPVAEFQNLISERVGYAVRVRAKMAWRSPGQLWSAGATAIPASSASERTRWRFVMQAAPYARYLFVHFWQARQQGAATDCYARLRMTDSAGALIGDAIRHYGSGAALADTPASFSASILGLVDTNEDLVEIPAGDVMFGTFADFANGRLAAACVWEVALDPDTTNGYPDVSAGSGSPIYDKDRSDAATMINAQWAYGAQPLWHWSVDTDAGARTVGLGELSGSLTQTISPFTLAATGTVATTAPVYQAQWAPSTSTSPTMLLNWPTHLTNDIGIIFVVGPDTGESEIPTISGGGDWTLVGSINCAHLFRARATSSSMGAPTVTFNSDEGELCGAVLVTFRGCITSGDPIDAWGSLDISTPTTTVTAASTSPPTTTVANTLLVGFVGTPTAASFASWAHAGTATDVTERVDSQATGFAMAVVTGTLAAAGSASYFTATASVETEQGCFLIAFKP